MSCLAFPLRQQSLTFALLDCDHSIPIIVLINVVVNILVKPREALVVYFLDSS